MDVIIIRKMASVKAKGTLISTKYPPLIDPTRTPLAYGNRAVPRLDRELNDSTLLTRQRALMSLCDYLHDPEHIAEVLVTPIPFSLKKLLGDSDLTVRQKATECLYVIASHALGREAFLFCKLIVPVSQLFHDKEDIARKNAHLAIQRVSESPQGAQGIVQSNLIKVLIGKLKDEVDEIKDLILGTLHFCMLYLVGDAIYEDDAKVFKDLLENNGMEIFTDLLSHESSLIRAEAARDIFDLCAILPGKEKAVAVNCMPKLVALLADSDDNVRSMAALAIMIIAITTPGKYNALHNDAITSLLSLVDDSTSEVRLNAIKALTCLSETPKGRKELLEHVDQIRAREEDSIPAVAKAAKRAVQVITWLP